MSNITGGNAKGWKEEQTVFGVFWRRGNEKYESPAPVLIFTSEEEAKGVLDNQIDNPLVHGSLSNVVSGCVKKGRTVKGASKVELIATVYERGKRFL